MTMTKITPLDFRRDDTTGALEFVPFARAVDRVLAERFGGDASMYESAYLEAGARWPDLAGVAAALAAGRID